MKIKPLKVVFSIRTLEPPHLYETKTPESSLTSLAYLPPGPSDKYERQTSCGRHMQPLLLKTETSDKNV